MNKKSIITVLLALVALIGWAQTKTATITINSPALKDSTIVCVGIGSLGQDVGAIQNGRFSFTLPVDNLTMVDVSLIGEGCPNFSFNIFVRPGAEVKLSGDDCLYPLWKVESLVAEQQTQNRITEHCRDLIADLLRLQLSGDYDKLEAIEMKLTKRQLDILPSLPVDEASVNTLVGIAITAKNNKDFPYMEQLKTLEKSYAARSPQSLKKQMDEVYAYIYPPRLLQVGDEAADFELFDMQGNKHDLIEALSDGRFVLLDFWGIGCGACRYSEPELKVFYEKIKNKLEIVGISADDVSNWKKHEVSKRIVWTNLNDGMKGINIRNTYCDVAAMPYYVLISPDKRIVWKAMGYNPGWFLGIADIVNGLGIKQDNSANYHFSVRQVNAAANGTTIGFRYYGHKDYWFRFVKDSYIEANGKKYKLTAADGIILDENNYPTVKATDATEGFESGLNYTDFTLTFEPFDTMPESFDFKEGDGEGAFIIRNVSLK